MSNFIKRQVISWILYFVFGKIPKQWTVKDEVRMFLVKNQQLIQWLVGAIFPKISTGFTALYSTVIGNKVLFDVFFDTVMFLRTNPSSLIVDRNSLISPVNIDDKGFMDRIRERIKRRRSLPGTSISEELEASSPGAIRAVVLASDAVSQLATIMVSIEQFR